MSAALTQPASARCAMVHDLVAKEAARLPLLGARRRRPACHVRQVSMYLCHTLLQMPLTEVGHGFKLDRTTARHACRVVEDLRDDPSYDAFLATLETAIGARH